MHKEKAAGLHVVEVQDNKGSIVYTTDEYQTREEAEATAKRWSEWADGVPAGIVDSIYYILLSHSCGLALLLKRIDTLVYISKLEGQMTF